MESADFLAEGRSAYISMFFLQERQGTEDAHPSAMLCTTRFAMRSAPTRLSERVSISSKAIAKWDTLKWLQMEMREKKIQRACHPSGLQNRTTSCVSQRGETVSSPSLRHRLPLARSWLGRRYDWS